MAEPDYTLIQLSDTHLRGEGLMHDVIDTTERLRLALETIVASRLRPAAVILTGDLTDHGEPIAYERLRELVLPVVAELGTELICLAGNHDDGPTLCEAMLGGGEHDRVHRLGGLRVVTLDSTVPGHHHGELSDEQLRWLARELEQAAPDGTILAIHHPPLPSSLNALDGFSLREPHRLAQAISATDVRLVISGHNHTTSCGSAGGVPVWVAPALAYYVDPIAADGAMRGVQAGGFTRIDVFDGVPIASHVPVGAGERIFEYSAEQVGALVAQYA